MATTEIILDPEDGSYVGIDSDGCAEFGNKWIVHWSGELGLLERAIKQLREATPPEATHKPRSAKEALDRVHESVKVHVLAEIEATGYATVNAVRERCGLRENHAAALAVPLRKLEAEGVLVRFKLPSGLLAWGYAP